MALNDELLRDDLAGADVIEYPNVSAAIGAALSSGKATYRDLNEMSVEDLHDILEVITVDGRNSRAVRAAYERKHEAEARAR